MSRKLLFVVLAILVIALGLASYQVAALTFVPPATEAATGRADTCAQRGLPSTPRPSRRSTSILKRPSWTRGILGQRSGLQDRLGASQGT